MALMTAHMHLINSDRNYLLFTFLVNRIDLNKDIQYIYLYIYIYAYICTYMIHTLLYRLSHWIYCLIATNCGMCDLWPGNVFQTFSISLYQ
jgi:hypothetical protein